MKLTPLTISFIITVSSSVIVVCKPHHIYKRKVLYYILKIFFIPKTKSFYIIADKNHQNSDKKLGIDKYCFTLFT